MHSDRRRAASHEQNSAASFARSFLAGFDNGAFSIVLSIHVVHVPYMNSVYDGVVLSLYFFRQVIVQCCCIIYPLMNESQLIIINNTVTVRRSFEEGKHDTHIATKLRAYELKYTLNEWMISIPGSSLS